MKRLALLFATVALGALALAPTAQAEFGFREFDLKFLNADGSPDTQAGSHPFAVVNRLHFNALADEGGDEYPDEMVKDITVGLPDGLVGYPTATPRCPSPDFINFVQETKLPRCSNSTAVGTVVVKAINQIGTTPAYISAPVYNLLPPPGVVQKLGFIAYGVPVAIEFTVNPEPPYNIEANLHDIAQPLPVLGSTLTVWGNPASPVHDKERGSCIKVNLFKEDKVATTGESCPTNVAPSPFITSPRACTGPLATTFEADSWTRPGIWARGSVLTHDNAEPPNPVGFTGCAKLGFKPTIAAQPTTKAAQSPSGLDFSLDVSDEGLLNSAGLAQSDIRKAVVTLPEGMSTNPSLAEGLTTCSEADLDRESVGSKPGAGCPNESKIGTVQVQTPLLEESVEGSLFIATPYENPFDSLLALYMVIKNPTLGIVIKQPLKVETDPLTGQITTVAEELPQLPFSHFKLHFREGTRSPLSSPPLCGSYDAKAVLTPWAGGAPVTTTSAFEVISGPDAGPCPSGTSQPFKPRLEAGTLNNAAGRYSPFYLRISREDGEQEITNFSIKLPPGVTGKLAGIPYCPDLAIALAASRTGPHGGQEELDNPSCPAASEVGRTLVGVGVGPSLAYAPGKLYLAGPYNGSALSIVSITAARVGPFDLGTVVVRLALRINPATAEVFVDATGSDPIPHIIKGIPVHLRDIRGYVDRPEFTLNPTSCERTSTASTVLGSGADFGSSADDQPITVTSPFQAADCAGLPYKPRLSLTLKGGTRRGDFPALRAVLRPRAGDANSKRIAVALPHSEFLEQGHIGTVCTRVQFKAGEVPGEQCPAAAIYGRATAYTPLFAEPLKGPVFLRSSNHPLPDLVLALHGVVDIEAAGRIDSVRGGQIRNTFDFVPDAPVTKVVVDFFGGKKGLLVNSTDLCRRTYRASAEFEAHSGRRASLKAPLQVRCGKGKGRKGSVGTYMSGN